MLPFDKSLFTYTPLFCEENIWKLTESFRYHPKIKTRDVLFIINSNNTVALFEQINSIGHQPVIWDYHVILTSYIDQQLYVFDFDSRCEFPCEINRYFNITFPDNIELLGTFSPKIRRLRSDEYLNYFSSNRQHMRGIIPESEFPSYDIIQSNSLDNMLTLDMCRDINLTINNSEILSPDDYLIYL